MNTIDTIATMSEKNDFAGLLRSLVARDKREEETTNKNGKILGNIFARKPHTVTLSGLDTYSVTARNPERAAAAAILRWFRHNGERYTTANVATPSYNETVIFGAGGNPESCRPDYDSPEFVSMAQLPADRRIDDMDYGD